MNVCSSKYLKFVLTIQKDFFAQKLLDGDDKIENLLEFCFDSNGGEMSCFFGLFSTQSVRVTMTHLHCIQTYVKPQEIS